MYIWTHRPRRASASKALVNEFKVVQRQQQVLSGGSEKLRVGSTRRLGPQSQSAE